MTSAPTAPPLDTATERTAERRRALWVLLAVLAATLALYARALGGEFVYDDKLLIERNPRITSLADPLELLASPYWDFLDPGSAQQIGYWRPLTALANAVGFALGGGTPLAFHAIGLAVHLAATAVAFVLVRRLVPGLLVAGTAALVFGVHPAHVESVAWISALNDPLFGLFGLLAVERFLAWRQRGSAGLPVGAALAFALALASKELGAAVVPLCLALDLARRERAALVRAYSPFVAVLALYLAARVAVFGSWTAGFERETTDFGVGAWRLALLRVELLGGALEVLAVPHDLKLFRAFRPDYTLTSPAVLEALAWVAGATVLGVVCWLRRATAAAFALLLIPAALAPALVKVSSLGSFPLADRFLYVPVLGAGLLLGLAVRAIGSRAAVLPAVLVVCGFYAAKAHERIGTFQDEVTLFETAAAETPRSPYVWWGLGRVHLQRFRDGEELPSLDRAFEAFECAQDLLAEAVQGADDLFVAERDFLQTNLGLGWAWLYRARHDPAESYSTAIGLLELLAKEIEAIETRAAEARRQGMRVIGGGLELESVYVPLAWGHIWSGNAAEGEERLRRALRLAPDYPPANSAMGQLLFDRREFDRAEEHFRRVVAQVPRHEEARMFLARCAFEQGRVDEAIAAARELDAAGAAGGEPAVLLAVAAMQANDVPAALAHLDRALERDPENGNAWYQRGNAFLLQQDPERALDAYRRAAERLPHVFEVHYQLGVLLLQGGALDAARPHLVRAYDIGTRPDLMGALRQTLADLPDGDAGYFLALSKSDRQRGALDQAEAWQDAATTIAPGSPSVLREQARLLEARGRPEEAVEWLERLTAAAPDSYVAWTEYGAALAKLGRDESAIPALEQALALGPPPAWPDALRASSTRALEERLRRLRGE